MCVISLSGDPTISDLGTLRLDQGEKSRGVLWGEANTSVRSRPAKGAGRIRAVNRKLSMEEDGMRHRGVVILIGMDHYVERARP